MLCQFNPFGFISQSNARLFEEECLFLQSTAVRDNQDAVFQQVNHFKITHRIDNFYRIRGFQVQCFDRLPGSGMKRQDNRNFF